MLPLPSKESVVTEVENELKAAARADGKPLFKSHRFGPLSFTGTLLRAFANGIYLFVDLVLYAILKATHPHTSEESEIHEWLARYGLKWKDAKAAQHIARIGNLTAPPPVDVPIAIGTIVYTNGTGLDRVSFRTIAEATLKTDTPVDARGYYTVPVTVECLETGIRGNVASDTIVNIENPPVGVDTVYNPDPDPIVSGTPRETLNQARSRVAAAEIGTTGMWLPAWYESIASGFSTVARAIFKSSKSLAIPGTVKIFCLGAAGPLTQAELQAIKDTFLLDENDPGGAAKVLVENITAIEVTRTVTVKFPDLASIPEQPVLDEVFDRYFTGLSESDDYIENDLELLYLAIPRTLFVTFNPPGNVVINAGEIAVPSATFSVTAEVYVP